MSKQFKSNQELDKYVENYIKNNCNLSEYPFFKFGIIPNPLDYLGSWEEYAKIIINEGYNIDNLRNELCDEFIKAYDNIKK